MALPVINPCYVTILINLHTIKNAAVPYLNEKLKTNFKTKLKQMTNHCRVPRESSSFSPHNVVLWDKRKYFRRWHWWTDCVNKIMNGATLFDCSNQKQTWWTRFKWLRFYVNIKIAASSTRSQSISRIKNWMSIRNNWRHKDSKIWR